MKIHEIRDNLENTIKGKEAMLAGLRKDDSAGYYILSHMLEINIEELKKILTDIELCMNDTAANSWVGSVDRQSGAFDEDELRGRDGWL